MVFIMDKRLMCPQCDEIPPLLLQHLDMRSLSDYQATKVDLPGMGLVPLGEAAPELACF